MSSCRGGRLRESCPRWAQSPTHWRRVPTRCPPPDDEEVEQLLRTVALRVVRLFRKQGKLDNVTYDGVLDALRLARYGSRGPVAESRLRRLDDGRYEYTPKGDGLPLVLTAEALMKRLPLLRRQSQGDPVSIGPPSRPAPSARTSGAAPAAAAEESWPWCRATAPPRRCSSASASSSPASSSLPATARTRLSSPCPCDAMRWDARGFDSQGHVRHPRGIRPIWAPPQEVRDHCVTLSRPGRLQEGAQVRRIVLPLLRSRGRWRGSAPPPSRA